MARTNPFRGRNTAPLWKKVTLIAAAILTPAVIVRLTHATSWSFFLFAPLVIVCAAVGLWVAAKLVGVRLSLGSWDDASPRRRG